MAVSALFRDKRVILTVGLWLIFLPIGLFNMVIAWRIDEMGNMPFSAAFPLSYLLPQFSFGVLLLEYYIIGGVEEIFGLNL